MKTHKIELPQQKEYHFYKIGDIHVGAAATRLDYFKRLVDTIASDEYAFVNGIGDWVDAVTHNDKKRFNPAEVDSENFSIKDLADLPRKQADLLLKILEPIKDKMLYLVAGNHETSVAKYNTFDVYNYYAEVLGVPKERRLGTNGIVRVVLPVTKTTRVSRSMCLLHGIGGGGFREGYAKNHITDIFRKYNTDVNIMGHIHKSEAFATNEIGIDRVGRLQYRRRWFGSTGSYMQSIQEGKANYFEVSKGQVGEIGSLVYNIKPNYDGTFTDELKQILF